MKILGIHCYGHDTAAALVVDGKLRSAVEEERLSRRKHDSGLPFNAIRFCLDEAGIGIGDVDFIAFSTDLDWLVQRKYLQYHLDDFAARRDHLIQSAANIENILTREQRILDEIGYSGPRKSFRHHLCHLASAYYQSGFAECAAVSIDGQGEFETTLIGTGAGSRVTPMKSLDFPNSLGLVYTAVTYHLGFQPHHAEGTVMALAAFGDGDAKIPGQARSYYELLCEMVKPSDDGTFNVDTSWFNFPFTRKGWVSDKFTAVFGPSRTREEAVTDNHRNIAAALQRRFEDIYLHVLDHAQKQTGSKNLALAGGCALNCVANGKILMTTGFERIYIQPASGDAGCAIGAAQLAAQELGEPIRSEQRLHTYLGPRYDNDEIEKVLREKGERFEGPVDTAEAGAELLAKGHVVAWFQGAAEFGPRALGNRSILAAPFPLAMKDRINAKVKHREAFRPFAPAVMEDRYGEVFNATHPSPFMLMALTAQDDWHDRIPAVLHEDDSARVQTVSAATNARFYDLLSHFNDKTGVPVLLNTSFNDKGEPIVCSPEDALRTFHGTDIDYLVIGDYVVSK
jgi:carbamoyltransferase